MYWNDPWNFWMIWMSAMSIHRLPEVDARNESFSEWQVDVPKERRSLWWSWSTCHVEHQEIHHVRFEQSWVEDVMKKVHQTCRVSMYQDSNVIKTSCLLWFWLTSVDDIYLNILQLVAGLKRQPKTTAPWWWLSARDPWNQTTAAVVIDWYFERLIEMFHVPSFGQNLDISWRVVFFRTITTPEVIVVWWTYAPKRPPVRPCGKCEQDWVPKTWLVDHNKLDVIYTSLFYMFVLYLYVCFICLFYMFVLYVCCSIG